MNQGTDNNICRICLKNQDTLFSLFRNRHGSTPYQKLISKTNLKIKLNDAGPPFICSQCLMDLDTTVSFLEKCEQSNRALAAGIVRCSKDSEYNSEVDVATELDATNDDETSTHPINNVHYNNDALKEPKPSEVIMAAHKCPDCDSKRRCKHWAPPTSYTCQYCDKIFNKKYNFQIHLKRHLGEKDWACPQCGSLHLTEALARRHCRPKARRHCPVPDCHKTFTNNANLRIHIRSHSGERPFECHDCGKQFTSKKTLTDHIRIHTGEKPYMCSVCGARFTSNHLSSHMRSHGGGPARAHACPRAACPRRFPSLAALRSHARSHRPARPFACPAPACKRRYKFKQSLNYHVRTHHSAISSQQ